MPLLRVIASWPIRRKLLLVVILLFLSVGVFITRLGLEKRSELITKAEKDTLLLVESLAAQQEQIAIGTEQMLSTLAHLPEVQALDARACNELFRGLANHYPFYSFLGAVTPDGNIFAGSLPFDPGSVNLSHRKHIKDVIRTLDFSAGEYLLAQISKARSIHYAYPVLDADKNLVAIVIAGFRLDEYARFMTKANLPDGYVLTITDHGGVRLYRLPETGATAPGTPLPAVAFERMSGNSDCGLFEKLGQDDIYRIYAFKKLRLRNQSAPYLYVVVGIPKDKMLQQTNLEMLRNLSILGVAALVAVCLTWVFGNVFFLRPINHLVAATRQIGTGGIGARTGLPHTPDEFGRLAESFDSMALLLEMQDLKRRQADEELRKSRDELELRVQERTAALMEANEQLRLVPSKLIAVQENERRRLAVELHDSIAQTLAALKFRIEAILLTRDRGDSEGPLQPLENFVPILQRSIDETRSIYMGLRPKSLEDMGLLTTMKWFCRETLNLNPKHHIELSMEIEEGEIPEELKVVIFRITQEALNNMVKHSRAEWVDVSLLKNGEAIKLTITDDGVGMDLDYILKTRTANSLGLTGMRERAELTGGILSVESSPGEGTTVQVRWPLPKSLVHQSVLQTAIC